MDAKITKSMRKMSPSPRTQAAALRYKPERDLAPQVTALGKGYIADKIIETANRAGIPLYRDEELIKTLGRLRVGDEIPRELYEVVAEVLAFVFRIDSSYKK